MNKQGNTVVYRVSVYLGERANVWNWDRAHSNSKTEGVGGSVCSKSVILLTAQIYHYPASREGVKRLSLYPFFISSIHMGVRPNVLTPQPKVRQKKLISEGLMKNIKGPSSGVTHREKDKFFSIVLSDRKKSQKLLIYKEKKNAQRSIT